MHSRRRSAAVSCSLSSPPSAGQADGCCAHVPGHISLFNVPASGTANYFGPCSFLQFRTDGSLPQSPLPPRDSAAKSESENKKAPLLNGKFSRGACPFGIILLRVPGGHELYQSSIKSLLDGQKSLYSCGFTPSQVSFPLAKWLLILNAFV